MILKLLTCGSFNKQDQEVETWKKRSCSTKRNSKKSNKNPFSALGRDKFSALLADLEEKRQRILLQTGSSQDIITVRFVYSSSNECVPIVVKRKFPKKGNIKAANGVKDGAICNIEVVDKLPIKNSLDGIENKELKRPIRSGTEKKNKRITWNIKWSSSNYYLPVLVICIILLFLAIFGRPAAIILTSIVWYTLPSFSLTSSARRPVKKKEMKRYSSELKIGNRGTPARKFTRRNSTL